ncbi:MAG: ABC transporter permease [Alphaproteobacteria bacterium]|nr:ABC transporter permease [Alphaproteobacteria bacterium]MCB9698522.1 ABC transporter permease [Alphaproteobacteria bacterium]
MWKYVVRKIALAIPLVWCVVTLVFLLLELSPGTVADKFFTPDTPPELQQLIVEQYHLDDPAWVRYLAMLRNLVLFDFGSSMATGRPVLEIVQSALPNTLLLSFTTLCTLFPLGVAIGTLQAVRHRTPLDTTLSVGSLVLYSMPEFWYAMLLQLFAALLWSEWIRHLGEVGTLSEHWVTLLELPATDMKDPISYEYMAFPEQMLDRFKHLLLPGFGMALASSAGVARYMRSGMLEVVRQDFIRTARAKGLRERTVILRHAMRNAMLPIITLIGLSVPALFSGSVIIESIFAWPGMGREIVTAIYTQDTPVLIAMFYVFSLLVAAGNLIADISYAWADPRIKMG